MSPRIRGAIAAWMPAPDGAPWSQITAAWVALAFLIEDAVERDRQEYP